ncbi:hypothetical protein NGRA_3626, partial [Nosema granulosis]
RDLTTAPLYLTNPEKARAVEQTFESITFSLKMDDDIEIQDRPKVKIYKFTDSKVQDFVTWAKKFRELAGHNNWAADYSLKMLNLVIDEQFLIRISDKRTFDTKLDALGELIFTPNDYTTYLELLKRAQRRKFPDITGFITFIRECRARADLCNKNDKISEREVTDVVIRSL